MHHLIRRSILAASLLMAACLLVLALATAASSHTILIGKNRAHDSIKTCTETFTPKDYRVYASKVYRRKSIRRPAFSRMHRMHICQASYEHRKKVGALHRKFYRARKARILAAQRPVITPLMDCIMKHESTYNPLAQNGQYKGLAQWSPEAWARHGGLRYASTPHGASYWEQVQVLANGLRMYGCRDWCPFDPC